MAIEENNRDGRLPQEQDGDNGPSTSGEQPVRVGVVSWRFKCVTTSRKNLKILTNLRAQISSSPLISFSPFVLSSVLVGQREQHERPSFGHFLRERNYKETRLDARVHMRALITVTLNSR